MSPLIRTRRLLLFALVVGGLLAFALWPATVPVDVATVSRGPMVVTVDEEGRTRIRERFVVSAPVTGRVLRIDLEPGDPVKRGDILARVRAEIPPLLDARSQAEARAAAGAARAELGRTRAEDERARAALAQAQRELARSRSLVGSGAISRQEVEARETDARLAGEAVKAAAFEVQAASAELARAEARLMSTPRRPPGETVAVTAPADGVVLRRLRESESVVPAGEPLLELGDPRGLEIVADLLSTDAVRVRPGARAMLDQWGEEAALEAKVRLVEPSGFTKLSALGVEEQRVNVVLDFVDPPAAAARLGDAYRVELRVVVWEAAGVLKVPTSALFREGGQWAVYEVSDGRARTAIVRLGNRNGVEAEVLAGLVEGSRVIVHPGDRIENGVRVKAR